jgi:hypothetical protein
VVTAKLYLDKEWGHFDVGTREGILTFIEKSVIADPMFQRTPREYLHTWRMRRGGSEMLITPNDPAMRFLESLEAEGQLETFAKQVAESGLKPAAGVELQSSAWKR